MKPTNSKISEQFVNFIDLTDENLEEINLPEVGGIQGAWGSSCSCYDFSVSASSFAGSCSCGGSCGSCGSCDYSSCSCGSCSCGSCSCGSCDYSSCSCGSCSCGGFWN